METSLWHRKSFTSRYLETWRKTTKSKLLSIFKKNLVFSLSLGCLHEVSCLQDHISSFAFMWVTKVIHLTRRSWCVLWFLTSKRLWCENDTIKTYVTAQETCCDIYRTSSYYYLRIRDMFKTCLKFKIFCN